MNLLKNRKVAAFIMAVVIALSSVLGMMRSVISERNKVDDAFRFGCDGDGNSILGDLDEIISYTHNFRGVAVKYLGADSEIITRIEKSTEALSSAETPALKSDALDLLYASITEAWRLLQDSDELSDTDLKACKIAFYDIDDRKNKISHDGYNQLALEYNRMLGEFPVSLIAGLSFVSEAELFD